MECVTTIVGPVVESLIVTVMEHIGYLISYKKYVANMHSKKTVLDAKRDGVENHMNHNKSNNLEIPPEVKGWLTKVGKIDAEVESIPRYVDRFNLNDRFEVGRKAFNIIQDIDNLMKENSDIKWTGHPIPLGKIDSMKASTSTPSTHHNDFKSREPTFMEALKALEPDHKSHMIALCGMGGVGKTVMVKKLKKAVSEKRLFDFIIEATIGEKVEVHKIQQYIADFLSLDLKESSTAARAIRLRKSFEVRSDGGKKKFLIILDDVWQFFDLNDIGLSPLPNEGIDFKVLLTSRDRGVCITMGVELNSILDVKVIENSEAHTFFFQLVKVSDDDDLDLELREIGKDIADGCKGLPIAIKIIARTLKGKRKHAWEDTRSRIESKNVDEAVRQVFEISYKNLHDEETRSTLLLCCLFPEDFDTPVEELVRYGWGLRIFNEVDSIRKARNRLNTCIERLIDANLLIQSEEDGCIKMHDLVRDFVLHMCSKGEYASVVGDMSKWPAKHMSEFCKRISITCTGMSEFPRDRKFTNLLLLKLMNGDKSFPEDFYQEMKKLEVIVYERMTYPLIPISLQYSSNLRMLCIHQCPFVFDCSPVGDLLNLEVLSFTKCTIEKLPSTIGNLKELKVLDLTGCSNLRIDDGVLKRLVKLEELYMRGVRQHANGDELVECSKNLDALEIEFFGINALPKNTSFEKLERFQISLGRSIKDYDIDSFENKFSFENKHSFENTLMLATNKGELLDSRLNVLFGKTKVLHMQVDDLNDLGDCLGESLPHLRCSFFSLRVLRIYKCANLKYLFTIHIANGLKQLERLEIDECPVLETLVDSREICEVEVITFPSLKLLSLKRLPMLMSLCKVGGIISEFPQLEELEFDNLPNFTTIYQDFLRKEAMSSKLKKLKINNMEKLKEIWPSQLSNNDEVMISQLREITVRWCHSLVNLFPSNPMSLLRHLEQLTVNYCLSIVVLFNIDLGSSSYVGEIEEANNLRSIHVESCWKLREVWRVKGVNNSNSHLPILGFQTVESLQIRESLPHLRCSFFSLRVLRICKCANLRYLFTIHIANGLKQLERLEIEQCPVLETLVDSDHEICEVEVIKFPSLKFLSLKYLRTLMSLCKGGNVIELPLLEELELDSLPNIISIHQHFLKEEVMSSKLKRLYIGNMEKLKEIWPSQLSNNDEVMISQLRVIQVSNCDSLVNLFPSNPMSLLHHLEQLTVMECNSIDVLFNIDLGSSSSSHVGEIEEDSSSNLRSIYVYNCLELREVWRVKGMNNSNSHLPILGFQIVESLQISQCKRLRNVFTPTTSNFDMRSLKEITIDKSNKLWRENKSNNEEINVTSNQDISEDNVAFPSYLIHTFHQLHTLHLGFFTQAEVVFKIDSSSCRNLATTQNNQQLPHLKELYLRGMERMSHVWKYDWKQLLVPKSSSFLNITSISLEKCGSIKYLFSPLMAKLLSKLIKIEISRCGAMEEVVSNIDVEDEEMDAFMSLSSHTNTTITFFPHLQTLELHGLPCLKRIDGVGKKLTSTISAASSVYDKSQCYQVGGAYWSSYQYVKSIDIYNCNALLTLIPSHVVGHNMPNLEKLRISNCDSLREIFESDEGVVNNAANIGDTIPRPIINITLPNLKTLHIKGCHGLEYIFTSCVLESLKKLQELEITYCSSIQVIVKQEGDGGLEDVVFPSLTSFTLVALPNLKGFFLGKNEFRWRLLDKVQIHGCPQMKIFTPGRSITPKLKYIDTDVGRHSLECGLNFDWTDAPLEEENQLYDSTTVADCV